MPVYCLRCGDEFQYMKYLKQHIKKKKPCVVLYYNLSFDDMISNYYEYDISEMITLMKNKVVTDKHKCIYCGEEYEKLNSYYKHVELYCKFKRNIVNSLPIKFKNEYSMEKIKHLEEKIKISEEKVKIYEEEIKELKEKDPLISTSNITINNNFNVKIELNEFGKKWHEFTKEELLKLKNEYEDIDEFFKIVVKEFVNKTFIEDITNYNIYTPMLGINNNSAVFDGFRWVLKNNQTIFYLIMLKIINIFKHFDILSNEEILYLESIVYSSKEEHSYDDDQIYNKLHDLYHIINYEIYNNKSNIKKNYQINYGKMINPVNEDKKYLNP